MKLRTRFRVEDYVSTSAMNTRSSLGLLVCGGLLVGCTFPSSRQVIPGSQAGVVQNVETGIITGVREVAIEGTKGNLGMYGGGLIGGAVGSGVGSGVGKSIATAGGAVVGAVAGQAVEEVATRKRAQEISVKMQDGRTVVITQEVQNGLFQEGDRVQVLNSGGQARIRMAIN